MEIQTSLVYFEFTKHFLSEYEDKIGKNFRLAWKTYRESIGNGYDTCGHDDVCLLPIIIWIFWCLLFLTCFPVIYSVWGKLTYSYRYHSNNLMCYMYGSDLRYSSIYVSLLEYVKGCCLCTWFICNEILAVCYFNHKDPLGCLLHSNW